MRRDLRQLFGAVMLCLIFTFQSVAQKDSTGYQLTIGGLYSTKDYLPHYLHSLVGGVFDYDFNGPYFRGGVVKSIEGKEGSSLDLGVDLIVINQSPVFNFQQVYAEYNWGSFSFFAGKKEVNTQEVKSPLSMGNYGISGNARPIPKIGLSFPQYWYPFGNNWISFKGSFYHGWFEEDRYVETPWLHEKSMYGRLGNERFSFVGGLNHYAIWGGVVKSTGEDLYQGIDDFFRLFIGNGRELPSAGEENGIGSHIGFWETGLNFLIEGVRINTYTHFLFEDGRSVQFWNFDDNRDRVYGVDLEFEENSPKIIERMTLEFMSTLYQQGPGLPNQIPPDVDNFGHQFGGRDDNYNNFLYRDGWTYQNRIIGNPLFIDRSLGAFYFNNVDDHGVAIISNRIRAFHLGISGQAFGWRYKLMSTFTKNFGTYAGRYNGRFNWGGVLTDPNFDYVFENGLKQNYFLLELENSPLPTNKNIDITIKLALDHGEMTKNLGVGLAVAYSGFFDDKSLERSN